MHWILPVLGIGLSETNGTSRTLAVFLCAKSQFIVMLGWVGSRKAGRSVCPVDQPTQLDTMIGLMLLGFKTIQTEAIVMPKSHSTKPPKQNTQSPNSSQKPQSRFNVFTRSGRSIARKIPFNEAIQIKTGHPEFSIKFDSMGIQV